jgi:hypothetical protein
MMKACILLLACCLVTFGQATVDGVVVNSVTGVPLAGVHVSSGVRTDPAGRFHLTVGSRGTLWLMAAYPGFLRNNKILRVRRGEAITNLRIELTPAAAISGRLDDEDGFPAEKALVYLFAFRASEGERKLERVAYVQSDDLGRYRFANLRPGRYWLQMQPNGLLASDRRYAPEYFPGTFEWRAAVPLELKPGEEFDHADVRFKKCEGVTVSGRVEPPHGAASLLPDDVDVPYGFRGQTERDGRFSFHDIPPGNYVLEAGTDDYEYSKDPRVGFQKLKVGKENLSGIVVETHELRPVPLACRTTIEGGGQVPELLALRLRPSGDSIQTRIQPGKGFVSGHYDIDVYPNLQRSDAILALRDGFRYPISAQLDGKEVLKTGFDLDSTTVGPLIVTLGNHAIEISGKLLDASGRPVVGEEFALMSAEPYPLSAAVTGADGTFRATLRRPGEYRFVLITDQDEWNDPDYLKAHAGQFPPLHVADGPNPPVILTLRR